MRQTAELSFLDRNAAFADVDLDAGGLLSLLIQLIAENYRGNGEDANDEIENIAVHISAPQR
jgi:hypothetical protein